jgi:hypothetical protein
MKTLNHINKNNEQYTVATRAWAKLCHNCSICRCGTVRGVRDGIHTLRYMA